MFCGENCGKGKTNRLKIDDGRIRRVNSLIEFEPERLVSIKFSRVPED